MVASGNAVGCYRKEKLPMETAGNVLSQFLVGLHILQYACRAATASSYACLTGVLYIM